MQKSAYFVKLLKDSVIKTLFLQKHDYSIRLNHNKTLFLIPVIIYWKNLIQHLEVNKVKLYV